MGIDEEFNEYYKISADHKRYDPKLFDLMQAERRKDQPPRQRYNNLDGMAERMKKGLPGYSIVDYAFKDAAGTCETAPDGSGGMNKGYYSWDSLGHAKKPPSISPWKASPDEANKVITKAAKYFGAVEVGFCEMDKRFVYATSGKREIVFEDVEKAYVTDEKAVIPNSYKWVIVLLVPMEYTENSYAPTPLEVTSNMGYSRMHFTTGTLAEMIRGLGYNAIPMGNDTAFSVPFAIKAGLGHLSRNGRLINWKYGQLTRISKIFTDLPLKPAEEMAPKGIVEFCEVCEKCAHACPSGSVPKGPRTRYNEKNPNLNPGALKWYCDEYLCSDYWHVVGTGCSICLRVCPFTKSQGFIHDVVKWMIRNVPQLNRFMVWADDLVGYGKMSDPTKYWDIPIEKHHN
ncbi:reductive dehalogenase [Candidatus Bathyarchaeota archaeon]|nr:reductive dehalogenase [Candidatus Bathyarchaeota archaeon]